MGVLAGDWRSAAFPRGQGGYEEIELFGGQSELFGVRHVPASAAGKGSVAAGVVVCPPTWTDAEVNGERELRLARRLSSQLGVVVQRFAYRGVGDPGARSSGNSGFGSLVHDARTAIEHLVDRCGVERVGLVGTRVGALVAARVARDLPPGTPLALWQPVLDPRQYLADAAAAAAAASPDHLPATHPTSAVRALLDSRLGRDLFAPAVVGNLVDMLGPHPRPLLLVQLHRRVGLAPAYRDAVGRLEALDFPVDVVYDPTEEEWWQVHEAREPSDDALTATAEWLGKQFA